MMITNYYVATRIPAQGGLVIAETNPSFPDEWKEKIEKKCMEVIVCDGTRSALSICPLGNGQTAVSMARRIAGSRLEKREHEAVRGVVISTNQLAEFLSEIPGEDALEMLFFPEGMQVIEEPGQWKGPGRIKTKRQEENHFLKKYNLRELMDFQKAVKAVIKSGCHVQLLVPDEMETLIQMACYEVLEPEQMEALYTISNGECTLSDAGILLTKEIVYQEKRLYRTMTFSQFLTFGHSFKEETEHTEVEIEKNCVEDGVQTCLEYIRNPFIPEYTLCEIRREFLGKTIEVYEEFQGKLRVELEEMEVEFCEIRDFMKVLYLAFENFHGECRYKDRIILPAPYDMEGMIYFIKAKQLSKREYRQYLTELAILQVQNQLHGIPARIVRKAVRLGGIYYE